MLPIAIVKQFIPIFVEISAMTSASKPVTQMLVDWSQGRTEALDELMPIVYEELRRLARRHLQRRCSYPSPGSVAKAVGCDNLNNVRRSHDHSSDRNCTWKPH